MSDLPIGNIGDILVYDSGWKILPHADAGLVLVSRGPGSTPHWQLIQGTLPVGVTHGDIMFFNGTLWTVLSPGTAGYTLQTGGAGADPAWASLTGLPAGVQGDIAYHNGAAWVVLNAGTDGYLLETNGAGANPSWTDPSTIPVAYRAINAIYSIDATDYQIECTANTFTVTLPTAAGITGRAYSIKNTGAGVITVACNGAETIDSIATQTLNQWDNIVVLSNGANWIII